MEQALCSILCKEIWRHEIYYEVFLKFNEDGTGELCSARGDDFVFIMAINTQWKVLSSAKEWLPVQSVAPEHNNLLTSKPELLGSLQIELTLQQSLAKSYQWHAYAQAANERVLTPAAYLPRTFTITFERGNFLRKWDEYPRKTGWMKHGWRYELRMTFDVSPFPPDEGWRQPPYPSPPVKEWWCPNLNATTTYYARHEGKLANDTARATNDDTLFGYEIGKCIML